MEHTKETDVWRVTLSGYIVVIYDLFHILGLVHNLFIFIIPIVMNCLCVFRPLSLSTPLLGMLQNYSFKKIISGLKRKNKSEKGLLLRDKKLEKCQIYIPSKTKKPSALKFCFAV